MKKLLLTAIIVMAGVFSANAQAWLGGSASFWTNDSHTSMKFAPEVGYSFRGTPWSIASAFGFSYDKLETTNILGQPVVAESKRFVASPYVRYAVAYVEKFMFFIDAVADLGFSGNENEDMAYRIGLQPGVLFMPTAKWAAGVRVGFLGYDNGGFGEKGFGFNYAQAVPQFALYYCF